MHRAALEQALRAATVPLTTPSGASKGTGFFVAPGLVLTCAHVVGPPGSVPEVMRSEATSFRSAGEFEVLGESYLPGDTGADLVLLRATDSAPSVCLAESADPGDVLWTFGYPDGTYRSGDSVVLRLEGVSERKDGTILLKGTQGRVTPAGYSNREGSPAP